MSPSASPHSPVRLTRLLSGALCALFLLALSGCGSAPRSSASAPPSGHTETGQASFYGDEFHGRKTANGERFDQSKLTAAHKRLPFGSMVRVTNTQNGKSVLVRVNDRGPFVTGRIIDLSSSAFRSIASLSAGVVPVRIEVVN